MAATYYIRNHKDGTAKNFVHFLKSLLFSLVKWFV